MKQKARKQVAGFVLDGGAERVRTDDPHNAIVVLYQLSYDPNQNRVKHNDLSALKSKPFSHSL
jgi:hypothetical protein